MKQILVNLCKTPFASLNVNNFNTKPNEDIQQNCNPEYVVPAVIPEPHAVVHEVPDVAVQQEPEALSRRLSVGAHDEDQE